MSQSLPPTPPHNLEPLIATVLHHTRGHLRAVLALQRARIVHPDQPDDAALAASCRAHWDALTKAKLALVRANRESK